MSVKKLSALKPLSIGLAVSLVLGLAGCSSIGKVVQLPEPKIDYKNSKSVKSLDVPPDLSSPEYDDTYARLPSGGVSANAYGQRQHIGQAAVNSAVLPAVNGVSMVNQGGVRYLQVAAAPEVLWPKLTGFWSTLGVSLMKDEPQIGVMETEWAENRAGLPMDWLRKITGSVFQGVYDAGVRDKFRLRVERAANGTNVYVSHQRAEEQVFSGGGVKWELKPADPELEAIILNRIALHLGGKAAKPVSANVSTVSNVVMTSVEGRPALRVSGGFSDVWLRTGVVLEQSGMSIEGQQKNAGIYNVVYRGAKSTRKQEGWFSKIFKTNKEVVKVGGDYQIHVADSGAYSLISVSNAEGEPVDVSVSQAMLTELKSFYQR